MRTSRTSCKRSLNLPVEIIVGHYSLVPHSSLGFELTYDKSTMYQRIPFNTILWPMKIWQMEYAYLEPLMFEPGHRTITVGPNRYALKFKTRDFLGYLWLKKLLPGMNQDV